MHSSNNAHGPRRRRWFLLAGVVLLATAIILTLHFRYCFFCSDATRVERAAELLCEPSDSALRRGLCMLDEAASNGHVAALALRGEIYLADLPKRYVLRRPELLECVRGRLAPDAARATESFRGLAAGSQAGPRDLYNLGILLESGQLSGAQIEGTATDYFRQAAEKGSSFGLFAQGWQAHLRGEYQLAAAKFRAAHNHGGHPEAALLLGDYYLYGHGMAKDRSQALEWYEKAEEAAQNAGFPEVVGDLAMEAQQRLQFASTREETKKEGEPVVVTYRLEGRPNEYRVFTSEHPDQPIGRVMDTNGTISARFENAAAPAEQQFATMNEGLDWVLRTYATDRLGAEGKVRFQLESQ